MKRSGGFTLVELMITLTIMTILMTVMVVNMLASQLDARDKEREIDIGSIALGLETFYSNGNPYANIPQGYYPGAQEVIAAAGSTPPFNNFLEGVGTTSYEAPKRTITNSFGIDSDYAGNPPGNNADGSYDESQARALLSSKPYLYQPLTRSNAFCAAYTNCVKYNLYYLTERDDAVHTIRSKNQ